MPRRERVTLLALVAGLCAGSLAAQDDGFEKDNPAFAPFRDLVARGDLLADDLPAADASSAGCMVNFTLRSVAPELGQPLTMTASADAASLDYENWQPEIKEGQVSAMIPSSGGAFLHMALASRDADARNLFQARLPARCTEDRCEATFPVPGFVFTVFDVDLSHAQAARDALQDFAKTCAEAG